MLYQAGIVAAKSFLTIVHAKRRNSCHAGWLLLLCMWQCKKKAENFEGFLQNHEDFPYGANRVSYGEIFFGFRPESFSQEEMSFHNVKSIL
jgi:hypothetical protein